MTKSESILLQLIRASIGDRHVDCNLPVVTVEEWKEVIDLAFEQGVDAISVDGYHQCLDNGAGDSLLESDESLEDLKFEWFGSVLQAESDYEQYKKTIFSLADFYAENGFKMMLLKGYGLSACWPRPSHRPTGDIDIFLGLDCVEPAFGQKDVWKKADKMIAEKLGIEVDNTHHHHSVFSYQGFSVENHFDFINAYDHRSSRMFEKLFKQMAAEGYKQHEECKNLYVPTDDFNALFVLKHCSGHYASTDITLRQVLDWLLFVRKHNDSIDWERLYKALDKFGLRRFAAIIGAIGVKYLGFSESLFYEISHDDALVERVVNDILSPEFKEKEDGSLISGLWVKPRRFWHNRWKHKLCYSDSFVSGFIWTTYAKLLKPRHFKL